MAIVGVGVDLVDINRFREKLRGTEGLLERLFAPAERGLSDQSLAARFAAKEALIKALGSSDGLSWAEIEIPKNDSRPEFVFSGVTSKSIADLNLSLHLSLSHDGGFATATVIAERA